MERQKEIIPSTFDILLRCEYQNAIWSLVR
jgi:hypothetical protein